jgi:hypothetical protein
LKSPNRDRRVEALVRIRLQIEETGPRAGYLSIARRHLEDGDSTCRWQATIVVGEYVETRAEQVWAVARRLATSSIKDIRVAASTVLLEHLLEYRPRSMVRRIEAELAIGNPRFRESVAMCWNFNRGRSGQKVQELIDRVKRSNIRLHPTPLARSRGPAGSRAPLARIGARRG